MSADSSIEWTDKTWNPVRGCSRVSAGCDNCYAMRVAHRFSGPAVADPSTDRSLDKPAGPYHGLTTIRRGKVDWSGKVRFVPAAVAEPVSWRKPRRVFVNSMSDLFHEALEDWQIDRVFGTMWACLYLGRHAVPGHTFQILTKRPQRALEYFAADRRRAWADAAVHAGGGIDPDALHDQTFYHQGPHPRIWLGVSVEDQDTANERIPLLLKLPAAVRFISAEPLLGPVLLDNGESSWLTCDGSQDRFDDCCGSFAAHGNHFHGIDWVIVGGESGNGARPFQVDWARSLVKQCAEAHVACFVKQLGARPWVPAGEKLAQWSDSVAFVDDAPTEPSELILANRKGSDMAQWPPQLRVRQFPEPRT